MNDGSPSLYAQGVLVQSMNLYAYGVMRPWQMARQMGMISRQIEGNPPKPLERGGMGPRFCQEYPEPVYLEKKTGNDHLVEEFDRMGEVYDAYVRPFSGPIMDEAVKELGRYLKPDFRLLDAGCGAGRELCRLSQLVPEGEVVGIDLAAGMVTAAWRSAYAKGFDNTAFFQSDVSDLPEPFEGQFDLVYSSLAHHHYPDPPAATEAIYRALRPGGLYTVIDAGPEWFIKMSAPLADWADPGWIGFHSPEAFQTLFANAGFEHTGWIELLPGFGIAIGRKPLE